MERTTIHRAIQGGGTGSGFQVPHQIIRKEESLLPIITRDAIRIAENNEIKYSSNNNSDPSEANRYKVWKQQLVNRLFYLSQKRKEFRQTLLPTQNEKLHERRYRAKC